VGIPWWMGFSRPQLVVVSGLFRWESLNGWDFLGHNLLSQASFHDGILAITKPLSRTFFSFFTMEFWLSRSLCHELFLFSRWNSGYHEAFLTNFSFFHDGTLAITKPFSQTFSFFTMELWLSRSLSHKLFLFSRWNFGYHEAFLTNFFFFYDGIFGIRDLGEDSFHTYITKSIYTGSASLKTLPLDLEPPLQGKEYGPSYSNTIGKSKTIFLSRNHL
jgi:hypothetical protein